MGWGVNDYPSPPDYDNVLCPVCGEECKTIVINENQEVIGCDRCLRIMDAQFWKEEQLEGI